MLKRSALSLLLLLALPSAAFAQESACAVFLSGSEGTAEYVRCMAVMERNEQTRRELQLLQGLSAHPYGQQQEQQRIYQADPVFRQEHMQNQQLNHGMGGCTPNFATGGCL